MIPRVLPSSRCTRTRARTRGRERFNWNSDRPRAGVVCNLAKMSQKSPGGSISAKLLEANLFPVPLQAQIRLGARRTKLCKTTALNGIPISDPTGYAPCDRTRCSTGLSAEKSGPAHFATCVFVAHYRLPRRCVFFLDSLPSDWTTRAVACCSNQQILRYNPPILYFDLYTWCKDT